MGTTGSYSIKYIDDLGQSKALTISGYEIRDSVVRINISTNTPMKNDYDYFLVLKTLAKDKAGNNSDYRYGDELLINR